MFFGIPAAYGAIAMGPRLFGTVGSLAEMAALGVAAILIGYRARRNKNAPNQAGWAMAFGVLATLSFIFLGLNLLGVPTQFSGYGGQP